MRTETKNEKYLGLLQERKKKILDCILFRLYFSFLQETEKNEGEKEGNREKQKSYCLSTTAKE